MKKNCKSCLKLKALVEFSKAHSNKDGYNSFCKICVADRVKQYYKTIPGIVTHIYNGEKTASKQRGHSLPTYNKQELNNWLHNNGLIILFNSWKNSGYKKELKPSVDRINSTEGYSFSNIRLVTWKENNDIAYEERKNCKRVTKQCKEVKQLTEDGILVYQFKSIANAARATGFCRTNINHACATGKELAHGFRWQYA
jgi:hypothetical protein